MKLKNMTICPADGQELVEVLTVVINSAVKELRAHVSSELSGLKDSQDELATELREHMRTHLPRRPQQKRSQSNELIS